MGSTSVNGIDILLKIHCRDLQKLLIKKGLANISGRLLNEANSAGKYLRDEF